MQTYLSQKAQSTKWVKACHLETFDAVRPGSALTKRSAKAEPNGVVLKNCEVRVVLVPLM